MKPAVNAYPLPPDRAVVPVGGRGVYREYADGMYCAVWDRFGAATVGFLGHGMDEFGVDPVNVLICEAFAMPMEN